MMISTDISDLNLPYYKQKGYDDLPALAFPYLALTIGFSVFVFLLETYLSFRQLLKYRDPKATIPKLLEAHISEKKFKESLSYGFEKLSFSTIESTFMLLESSVLVLLGYLPFVWDIATAVCVRTGVCAPNSTYSDIVKEVFVTVVFLGISTFHDTLVNLPFSLYSTFVVEERHGFNKTTLSLFFRDKALGLLLTFVIGAPILSVVIWLVRWGGQYFYFYVWGFLFVVSLILMTVYPTLIAPLFNKYDKLESGPVYSAIEELAKKVSFPLTQIYVVDGSKRSAHSNAYFYGFFKNKRIVLFDTLMKQVELEELLAILGHEMGHWKLWHTIQGFVVSQLYTFAIFLTFSYVQNSYDLFQSFGFVYDKDQRVPVFIGLMLFAQTYWMPVEKVLGLALNFNSRINEFAADAFSKKLGKAEALATGLIKISIENLGNMVPDSLYSLYHFSHPPLVERLSALGAIDKKTN